MVRCGPYPTFRSSRADCGAQTLLSARATVPPPLRESSSRVFQFARLLRSRPSGVRGPAPPWTLRRPFGMAAARQGLPVRLDRAPQRGAAFALTRASRRARMRSISSRSRARGVHRPRAQEVYRSFLNIPRRRYATSREGHASQD
jgi:hypothetical protein